MKSKYTIDCRIKTKWEFLNGEVTIWMAIRSDDVDTIQP